MMLIKGKVWKSQKSKFWLVEVPDLDVTTQGETKAEALEMIQDAIECLVEVKGFKVRVHPQPGGGIFIDTNNDAALIALMLRRQRGRSGLTVREVAVRMGSNSPNAYSAYERGLRAPSMDQLEKLFKAVNSNGRLIFTSHEDEVTPIKKKA